MAIQLTTMTKNEKRAYNLISKYNQAQNRLFAAQVKATAAKIELVKALKLCEPGTDSAIDHHIANTENRAR